jgi:phage shock protein E
MIKKSLILTFVVLMFLFGCSPDLSVKKISAQEGRSLLQSDSSIILLDVRTVEEYKEIRIPGAMLIPLDTLKVQSSVLLSDKEATIIIYCRSGNRSKEAADLLIALGYNNIYDMGGIIDWPYETEKG